MPKLSAVPKGGDLLEETFLKPSEVAAKLRVSVRTVQNMCNRGDLEHVRVVGVMRITERSLRAYLDAARQRASA